MWCLACRHPLCFEAAKPTVERRPRLFVLRSKEAVLRVPENSTERVFQRCCLASETWGPAKVLHLSMQNPRLLDLCTLSTTKTTRPIQHLSPPTIGTTRATRAQHLSHCTHPDPPTQTGRRQKHRAARVTAPTNSPRTNPARNQGPHQSSCQRTQTYGAHRVQQTGRTCSKACKAHAGEK